MVTMECRLIIMPTRTALVTLLLANMTVVCRPPKPPSATRTTFIFALALPSPAPKLDSPAALLLIPHSPPSRLPLRLQELRSPEHLSRSRPMLLIMSASREFSSNLMAPISEAKILPLHTQQLGTPQLRQTAVTPKQPQPETRRGIP